MTINRVSHREVGWSRLGLFHGLININSEVPGYESHFAYLEDVSSFISSSHFLSLDLFRLPCAYRSDPKTVTLAILYSVGDIEL